MKGPVVFLHFGWQLTALLRPESLLDCVSEGNTVIVKMVIKGEDQVIFAAG